ncbi:hypothetical protein B5S28_g2798 [[Candida] boidinii]|nr:hypothetical protein B5S28_g2798 [[Candida] boidinii]GME89303.1 unnamed protein product [[Candida] boidinii]
MSKYTSVSGDSSLQDDSRTIDPFGDDELIQSDIPTTNQSNNNKTTNNNIDDHLFEEQDISDIPQTSSINPDILNSSEFSPKKQYDGSIFSLNYYRQFFDLETREFFSNCIHALNPFVKLSDEEINSVGDLYGAIWITGTVVFLLFFCNSLADVITEWMKDRGNKAGVNYFALIISSINLLYGYIFIIPLFLYLILRFYFKVNLLISLVRIISVYGYSNLLWIPAALLSVVRGILANHKTLDTILKWVCIAIGSILSGLNICLKLYFYFVKAFEGYASANQVNNQFYDKLPVVLACILVICHIGFSIGIRVSFFGDLN